MNSLTGIKDTDILILLQLEDRELGPVCSVNSYVRSLCDDPNFWRIRIMKKLEKSEEKIFKILKMSGDKINGNRIEDMKKYFGFETLKELNNFLNEIPIDIIYYLYATFEFVDVFISKLFEFDEKILPKYINFKELMFNIRRQVAINFFEEKKGRIVNPPILYIQREFPGYRQKYSPQQGIEMDKITYDLLVSLKNKRQ